jgi:hypothetical protein
MEQQNTQNINQTDNQNIEQNECMFEYDDVNEIKSNKNISEDSVVLPAGKESKIHHFFKEVTADPEVLDHESKETIELAAESSSYVNVKDVGSRDNIENMCPEVKTKDGKILTLKNVSTKIRKTNKESIKLKLAESLGIGTASHVPLWHSGFWVTIKPMKNREKIKLFLELAENINELGKKTHDLIYANTTYLFAKTILDFIRPRIVDTSFNVPEDKDIFDYIKVQDLNILVWGLLKTMYPKGFNYILQCKNTLKLQEDKKPLCNFKAEVMLDLSKMLWVDTKRLSENEDYDHIAHMSKRRSRSVTEEEVLKYQETLDANNGDTYSFTSNDLSVVLNVESPSISKFLEYGELFINNMNNTINELIEEGLLNEKSVITNKQEAEFVILKTIELQMYNHFVKSIVVNGEIQTEPNDINDMLEIISNDNKLKKEIKDKIIKYIDNSLIAIIGIPDYTCPVCKQSQVEDKESNFRSFIGLDVFMYFFTLMGSQYQKAIQELEIS